MWRAMAPAGVVACVERLDVHDQVGGLLVERGQLVVGPWRSASFLSVSARRSGLGRRIGPGRFACGQQVEDVAGDELVAVERLSSALPNLAL